MRLKMDATPSADVPRDPVSSKHLNEVFSSSEFVNKVRHHDERRYLLLHLPGLHEHEKRSAAAQTEAG